MGSRAHRRARSTDIAVGIETPRGALVDTLLEQGCPRVCAQSETARSLSRSLYRRGAKDDRRDAHVVADALRTDRRAFRAVRADDPHDHSVTRAVSHRGRPAGRGRAAGNRLREQLYRVNAPWLSLSPAADEPWLWTVLARDTAPGALAAVAAAAHRAGPAGASHSAADGRGRRHRPAPADARGRARRGGCGGDADRVDGPAAGPDPSSNADHANGRSIALLETLAGGEAREGEPREHRDVEILRSLPGVGRMVTATMLTEAAGPLAARDYATLRAHAGTAPITKRSGKRVFFVHMRYACKWRLRLAAVPLVAGQHSTRRRGPRLLRRTPRTRSRSRPGPPERCGSMVADSRRDAHNGERSTTPHDSLEWRLRPLDKWWGVFLFFSCGVLTGGCRHKTNERASHSAIQSPPLFITTFSARNASAGMTTFDWRKPPSRVHHCTP